MHGPICYKMGESSIILNSPNLEAIYSGQDSVIKMCRNWHVHFDLHFPRKFHDLKVQPSEAHNPCPSLQNILCYHYINHYMPVFTSLISPFFSILISHILSLIMLVSPRFHHLPLLLLPLTSTLFNFLSQVLCSVFL